MNKKLGNPEQIINAYELKFDQGPAKDKSVILVHNGGLELMFSKDNGLDILYLKYNGKNVSFLSKNGITNDDKEFIKRFEAGFLYTCGMDCISDCVPGKPMHGSIHITPAEQVSISIDQEKVTVTGKVKDTALFGKNLILHRNFNVYSDRVEINDVIENRAYVDDEYVMLYHVNYGYPFLDEDLEIKMDLIKSVGRTPFATQGLSEQFKIIPPVDGGEEACFYNYLKEGNVSLVNKKLGVAVQMDYDIDALPLNIMWKSMVSGDYALGIEPTTSIFEEQFHLSPIKKGEKKEFKLSIKFSETK